MGRYQLEIEYQQKKLANQHSHFQKKNYGYNYHVSYKEKYPQQAPKMPKTVEDYADYAGIFSDNEQLQNTSMTRFRAEV